MNKRINNTIAWICLNQLKRLNLTEEMRHYLIGRQYDSERAAYWYSVEHTENIIQILKLVKVIDQRDDVFWGFDVGHLHRSVELFGVDVIGVKLIRKRVQSGNALIVEDVLKADGETPEIGINFVDWFSVLRGFISLKNGKIAVLHLRFCTLADMPLRREKAR